jgi:hypothetical protein
VHRPRKTLRDSLIAVLVVVAWALVAQVADGDLQARQRDAAATQGAT